VVLQPCFCQIDVALDSAKDFVVNHLFIAKHNNGFAFDLKRFVG
jgi:hypothetical protein